MDKTMNRKIGFRPENKPLKSQVAPKIESKPAPTVRPTRKEVPSNKPVTAEEVISWLKTHPMFAWGRMCVEIGIDKGNFSRTMASEAPVIAPEIVLKIISVISKYGFQAKL